MLSQPLPKLFLQLLREHFVYRDNKFDDLRDPITWLDLIGWLCENVNSSYSTWRLPILIQVICKKLMELLTSPRGFRNLLEPVLQTGLSLSAIQTIVLLKKNVRRHLVVANEFGGSEQPFSSAVLASIPSSDVRKPISYILCMLLEFLDSTKCFFRRFNKPSHDENLMLLVTFTTAIVFITVIAVMNTIAAIRR